MQMSSWLPFDAVCQAIIDVAFVKGKPERVLNLVHPRPVPWHDLMVHFADALVEQGICKRLPFIDMPLWCAKLADAGADAGNEDLKRIVCYTPASVLLVDSRS
jgi:hypothetical protein